MLAPAQDHAAALLQSVRSHVWDGCSLPVPVEEIAESHFGLLLRNVDAAELARASGAPVVAPGGSLSGLLLVGSGEIWVNAAEAEMSPGRRRFTIGHEIGHWVLHRERGRIFCRTSEVAEAHDAVRGVDIEEEASTFSAALMFPPPLVREQFVRMKGDFNALCEAFGGSAIATERAIFNVIRAPYAHDLGNVEVFYYDDPGYEAWRAEHHADGFVLNDDLRNLGAGKLHRACCTYLDRAPQVGQPRTRQPKWCGQDADALRDALGADACSRCKP